MGKSFFPLCDRNLKKTYGAKNARKTRKNRKNPLVFVHITRENRQKSTKSPKTAPKKHQFSALFRARAGPPGNPVFAPGTGGHPPTPPGVAPGAPEPPRTPPEDPPDPGRASGTLLAALRGRFPDSGPPSPGDFRRRKPPDRSLPQGGDTSERAGERRLGEPRRSGSGAGSKARNRAGPCFRGRGWATESADAAGAPPPRECRVRTTETTPVSATREAGDPSPRRRPVSTDSQTAPAPLGTGIPGLTNSRDVLRAPGQPRAAPHP